MDQRNNLQKLSLGGIAHRCGQETQRFFQRERHDPRFCFEMFRRAIVERNHDAWSLVYSQYRPLVAGWVERHSAYPACGEEVQYFVNRAFEKMWAAVPPEKFRRFPNLKSLLRYLQMCTNSAIVDHTRKSEPPVVDVEVEGHAWGDGTGGADAGSMERPVERLDRDELWRQVNTRLKDDRERAVVYCCFVLALKPREVQARCGELFRDVKDVYRVKENVLARLGRDTELQEILRGGT
jgi:DNA-directed RNA polymerase specialized sigma24 family protein